MEETYPGPRFSVGDALNYAWSAYWQQLPSFLTVTLVVILGNAVLGLLVTAIDSLAAQVIFNVLGLAVALLLSLGLIRAALDVTRGAAPSVANVLRTEGFAAYATATIMFVGGVYLGTVALVVPGIAFALAFHLYGYVLVDEPGLSATQALRRSAEITRGSRWQLLLLGLTLLAVNLVGLMLCFVGVVFTYGITAISVAYVYRILAGQPVTPP